MKKRSASHDCRVFVQIIPKCAAARKERISSHECSRILSRRSSSRRAIIHQLLSLIPSAKRRIISSATSLPLRDL
jgi:hypothetical protein